MSLRRACLSDLPNLAAMVMESAGLRQPLSREVVKKKAHSICEESLTDNSSLLFLVAEEKGEGVPRLTGYTSFYYTFSTWNGRTLHVKEVFVQPVHQGHGVGTKLAKEMVKMAAEGDCGRIDFLVDCSRQIEVDFSNKFRPVFVDFLNYKMAAESVKEFAEGGLVARRALGQVGIRPGSQQQSGDLLRLITELAVYEEEPDAVKIGELELKQGLLGPEKCYDLLVVEAPMQGGGGALAIGYVIFFTVHQHLERGIHLEDLYVAPDYRGRGIGTELIRSVAQRVVSNGWDFLRLQVLDWNVRPIALYQRLGGRCLDNVKNFRLERGHMAHLLKQWAGRAD